MASTTRSKPLLSRRVSRSSLHAPRFKSEPARMRNPAVIIPAAMDAIKALNAAIQQGGVPENMLGLVHLRASQINGCGVCVDSGTRYLKRAGQKDERVFSFAAWRDTPYFTRAERAALSLTEAATRLSDREDPVPDEIWDEAAHHFNEKELAALLLEISTTNVFNRLNVATRQIAGSWGG